MFRKCVAVHFLRFYPHENENPGKPRKKEKLEPILQTSSRCTRVLASMIHDRRNIQPLRISESSDKSHEAMVRPMLAKANGSRSLTSHRLSDGQIQGTSCPEFSLEIYSSTLSAFSPLLKFFLFLVITVVQMIRNRSSCQIKHNPNNKRDQQ